MEILCHTTRVYSELHGAVARSKLRLKLIDLKKRIFSEKHLIGDLTLIDGRRSRRDETPKVKLKVPVLCE